MAKLFPLKAIHYNPGTTDLNRVVIPPYDTISETEKHRYFSRDPHNFSHILLGKAEDPDYVLRGGQLKEWISQGILMEEPDAAFYLYGQKFNVEGSSFERFTLMAAVELVEFSENIIRPHEETHSGPKKDRLKILKQTQCNLSPIFGVVDNHDPVFLECSQKLRATPPLLQGRTDEGVYHSVWKIPKNWEQPLQNSYKDQPIYIVDGHHRYSSALNYAKETRSLGKLNLESSKMFFCIAQAKDPALIIFPTHRLLLNNAVSIKKEDLESQFTLEDFKAENLREFVKDPSQNPKFVLYLQNELFLCSPKDSNVISKEFGKELGKLSVLATDELLLSKACKLTPEEREHALSYERQFDIAWDNRNQYAAVLFLPPINIDNLIEVSSAKKFMPQKSTYFYPKLASGFIIRDLSQPL